MNAGIIGADPQVLRDMASKFDNAADQLDGVKGSVQIWVDRGDIWRGLDNQKFVTDWNSGGSSAVTIVAAQLRRSSNLLRVNADQQDAASSADGAGSGISGSGLFTAADGEPVNGRGTMRAFAEELTGRLNEIDDVLKWTGELFDAAGGMKFFARLSPALAGFQGGLNIVDDLAHNDGRRFFEHSAAAGLGIVGGMAGAKAGAGIGAVAGSMIFPGPGTAVGIVVGATLGSMAGTAIGTGVGGELGSAMDHGWRGEGPQYLEQKVDDLKKGITDQAKIMTQPILVPFAF